MTFPLNCFYFQSKTVALAILFFIETKYLHGVLAL